MSSTYYSYLPMQTQTAAKYCGNFLGLFSSDIFPPSHFPQATSVDNLIDLDTHEKYNIGKFHSNKKKICTPTDDSDIK